MRGPILHLEPRSIGLTPGGQPPRISIVMPSYNQAAFLEEAIVSILEQDYPNLELIVLDGGSTDGSREIIQRFSDRLSYWRSAPDSGQIAALIEGLQRATGDLLGWVNSDDVLLPGALRAIENAYKTQPDVGLLGGKYLLIDQHGVVIRSKVHPPRASLFARFGLMLVNQPGSVFSRSAYEAVGGLDPRFDYIMDTDLYIRMLRSNTRYVYIDRWLSCFRLHSSNKTNDMQKRTSERRVALRSWGPTPGGTAGRTLAKLSYHTYQLFNGRHLEMLRTTWQLRGTHWRDWPQQSAT